MNKSELIAFLSSLDENQAMCSISVRYDGDEFIGIGSLRIIDDMLHMFVIDEYDDISLTYNELKYYLRLNKQAFQKIKVIFEPSYEEKLIINAKIDDGEFEDILGDEKHPYFTTQ